MMRAARDGDHSAAKALLKLYGFGQIAAEIKPGKPYSNRVPQGDGSTVIKSSHSVSMPAVMASTALDDAAGEIALTPDL
jgi:hypothetical protein